MIPNLIGNKPNWKALKEGLAAMGREDIILIEDSADTVTHTAETDIATTSFYASHVITAGGAGGMVMFNDEKLRNICLQFRDWGRMGDNSEIMSDRFNHSVDGIPYDHKFLYGVANKPSAPLHMVFIGIVTRKNSNNGEIFVKVQNGFELEELHNVAISSIANKNLLMYEAATSLWKNNTLGNVIGGLSTQYVKGDGTLGSFPDIGGGGGLIYYLNGSVSGSAAGYYQMSKTPVFGAGADFSLTGNGLIVQFITDANDPSLLSVPSGAWRFGLYASMGTGGNSSKFYVEIYKYDGTTFTLIGSSSGTPESVVNGTAIEYYTTTVAVTTVALAVTDRIAIRVYATDNNTRTMTIHTENSHLCDVATTFPSGISSINGLITPSQYLSTTTTGTDFTISSTTNTHYFNLPVASSTVTGKLSSTDWTTFNNKQNALTNPITGTGTANYLSKFTTATSLANSLVYDNGTNVLIGTTTASTDYSTALLTLAKICVIRLFGGSGL